MGSHAMFPPTIPSFEYIITAITFMFQLIMNTLNMIYQWNVCFTLEITFAALVSVFIMIDTYMFFKKTMSTTYIITLTTTICYSFMPKLCVASQTILFCGFDIALLTYISYSFMLNKYRFFSTFWWGIIMYTYFALVSYRLLFRKLVVI